MTSMIIWITGASQGIGAGLARQAPFRDARIINISRRQNPDLENLTADLTDPASWDRIIDHVDRELRSFTGERAIFINNALYSGGIGDAGVVDAVEVRRQVYANVTAPLVLGDAFLRSCDGAGGRFDSGLVMVSSAAARYPLEGHATYGAAKAATEQWVRAVRAERRRLQRGPWVVAIRPGLVVGESYWRQGESQAGDYPGRQAVEAAVAAGNYLTPDEVARQMWELLPPDPDGRNVLFLGQMVEGAMIEAAPSKEP